MQFLAKEPLFAITDYLIPVDIRALHCVCKTINERLSKMDASIWLPRIMNGLYGKQLCESDTFVKSLNLECFLPIMRNEVKSNGKKKLSNE